MSVILGKRDVISVRVLLSYSRFGYLFFVFFFQNLIDRLFHREVNLLTKAFIAEQRYDLGKCRRTHDLALRADYAKANEEKELKYEYEVRLSQLY